jgi:hypothetical protein
VVGLMGAGSPPVAGLAAALALLPRPRGRFEEVLSRMPAPIFASLAALSLVTADRALAGGPCSSDGGAVGGWARSSSGPVVEMSRRWPC